MKFDGEICGGVLVENASDDFPQQKKLENLLPNFAGLRGPAAILFISRDTCSDSIAKVFCACLLWGYRTIIARYVAEWGIA